MLETELEEAATAILDAPEVALACHVSPDGDALGSMLALHHLCLAQGKPSVASWSEPFEVAPHYRFLPGLDLATKPADFPAEPEVMVSFDCGSLGRLGDLKANASAAGTLIVLDHHASNDHFGAINVIDPDAAATAVLVRRLARFLDWPLTREAAICLYTGLVTDTGRFQYSNTTPDVFELAHELSTFDLPIAELSRQLFEEHTFEYLKLVGDCIGRAELDHDLRFVSTSVTSGDLHTHGCQVDETEGLIDLLRRATEAEVSCVVKEAPEGLRVSLRAVSDTDVSAIAAHFGGGGHRYAAGFVAQGSVGAVVDEIKAELRAQRATTSHEVG
ncbi:MAG TPA: bifunctional oligoribonuclease/PAP phosphatase NrnA [Acidimicrobiales bacterium]|nr:bifunctional oligoribonuclease/PAP phosphatase NrnA [Acidimicrobiales bacterium]